MTVVGLVVAAVVYAQGGFSARTPPGNKDAVFLVRPAGDAGSSAAGVDRRPVGERRFLAIVTDFRDRFAAAATDMDRAAARSARAEALCAAMSTPAVQNWVGLMDAFSITGDGRGVLSVSIGDGVLVKTWTNAVSDLGDLTMLKPNTTLLAIAANAAAGHLVSFSGALIASKPNCFKDSGMSRSGITDPEFIFRFTTLREMAF